MDKAVVEHQTKETSDYGLIWAEALSYVFLNDRLDIVRSTFAIVEAILELSVAVKSQAQNE